MLIFRQSEPKDIVIDTIVYVENDDGDFIKMKIKEVLRPNDSWKAFCADDGCRYGLEGCYIKC